MSRAARDWAWSCRGLTLAPRCILLALAEHADEDGRCSPSLTRLAELTEADRRTVTRGLAELEARGLVERERRRGQGTTYTLAIGGRCTKVIPAEPPDPRDGGMKPPHQGRDAAGSMTPPGARNPRSRGVTPLSRKERPPDPVASEPPNRQRTGSEPSLCDDDVAHAPNLTANGPQNPGLVSDGSTRTPPELARCAEAGAATGKLSLEQRQACPDERPVERRGQTDDSGDSPCRPGLGRRCGQLAHAAPSPGEGVLR